MKQEYDYIVVGGGLAGSTISGMLTKRGCKVILFDDGHPQSSSRVAAGLINPITGRALKKTWMAKELFDYAFGYYQEAEKRTGMKFFYQKEIVRSFKDVEQQNDFIARSSDEAYQYFIDSINTTNQYSEYLNAPFGHVKLRHCGYLDIPAYLKALSSNALQNVITEKFDDQKLEVNSDGVIYNNDIRAKRIIFCTGVHQQGQRWFDWIPLRPSKGDVLDVKPSASTNIIFNQGVFLIPRHDGRYVAGSTYYNNDLTPDPTLKGRKEIMDKLIALFKIKFEIENQVAGIRPASRDRRPMIGRHPAAETIFLFNGLGTKGVTLAPYFAHMLCNHLEAKGKLDKEVDIKRFYNFYTN